MLHLKVPQLKNPDIVFRLAANQAEIDSADELICRNYIREGYWEDDRPFKENPYMRSSARIVMVIDNNGQIIGTISLIQDLFEHLPLDKYQPNMMDRFRGHGEKIAEVSALALDSFGHNQQRTLVLFLFKYLYQYAFYYLGIDRFVVATNARHAMFYRNVCCFDVVPSQFDYDYVNPEMKSELLTINLVMVHKALHERYETKDQAGNSFYRFLLVNDDPNLVFPMTSPIRRSRNIDWVRRARTYTEVQLVNAA